MKKNFVFAVFFMVIMAGCAEKEKNYDVTLMEVMSSSCGACEKMKPAMDKIKQKYKDSDAVNVIVYDTTTEKGAEIAAKYGVHHLPALIFLDKEKREYFRSEQPQPAGVISAVIEAKAGDE